MLVFRHASLAILISFSLSLLFWLGLGVFNLVGFWLVSIVCAIMGVLAGWFLGRRLLVTGLATLVIRIGVFFLVMSGGPA